MTPVRPSVLDPPGLKGWVQHWLHGNFIPIVCSGLLGLFFLPMFIQRQDSYITIHDNLDSLVSSHAILAKTGQILNWGGEEIIPQIMNGLPRSYLSTGLNLVHLYFLLFDPFTAYLGNYLIVHLAAFLGMGLLLSRFISPDVVQNQNSRQIIIWGAALAFAVLPFYVMYGLTIAGLPLLLYAFLDVFEGNAKWQDYLIICLIPFYSYLLLSGIFALSGLFILYLLGSIRKRKLELKALLILMAFGLIYIFTEYDFLRAVWFDPDFISHRSVWNLAYISYPVRGVAKNILSMFLHGQYHASSHQEWILVMIALGGVLSWRKGGQTQILLLILLGVQGLIAVIYGFYFVDALIPLKEKFGMISSFNFSRFHWLAPPIWYLMLAFSLLLIERNIPLRDRLKTGLIVSILAAQILVNTAYNSNYGTYISRVTPLPDFFNEGITYRQFYSEPLFDRIKEFIGLPQEDYRVVSLGIHPAIAQYNGFYTLDSYQPNYPLAYKEKFRQIIAPELAKSPQWQAYFDDWGSRCYVFSSELSGYLNTKKRNTSIQNLSLDLQAFESMGGRYIFSAVEIVNHQEIGLKLLGVFEDSGSVWRIFLYEVGA